MTTKDIPTVKVGLLNCKNKKERCRSFSGLIAVNIMYVVHLIISLGIQIFRCCLYSNLQLYIYARHVRQQFVQDVDFPTE